MIKLHIIWLLLCIHFGYLTGSQKSGPDPWDIRKEETSSLSSSHVPYDLRISKKQKTYSSNLGNGVWFFKRILAIILNGGQTKILEDGNVDISLQIYLNSEQWQTLNDYIKSDTPFTEEMFRRSTGYIEEAIYKPSVIENVSKAWSEYVEAFFEEYKFHITWFLVFTSVAGICIWIWQKVTSKQIIILFLIFLYLYEVVISYKEAEQKELEQFISAVNKCSWYFWNSSCDIQPPDIVIFMKYMNPLKIGIRMFSSLISEPMVTLNASVDMMIHGITDGLWFPFDRILHGTLVLCMNILLIFLMFMAIFNYILNIPLNFSLLGLFNIGFKQRKRNLNVNINDNSERGENADRISAATLDKILDVCSRALDSSQNRTTALNMPINSSNIPKLKRSSSTGRLPSEANHSYTFNSIGKPLANAITMEGGDTRGVPFLTSRHGYSK
ncbi:hypothetical protein ACJJTC_015702 [Scirpophaga incertulas]